MSRIKLISLLVKTYLLALLIFTLFRISLFVTESEMVDLGNDSVTTILRAFVIGVRFDLVIIGYIIVIPFLLLAVLDLINKLGKNVLRVTFVFIFICFSIAFTFCAADIPFFNQFFSRLTVSALEWNDNSWFIIKMVFQEPRYFIVLIPLILFNSLFYILLKRVFTIKGNGKKLKTVYRIIIYVFALAFILIGIRGRIQKKSPIRVGTAYYCNNQFLNQLGLNPVFTLMDSFKQSTHSSKNGVDFMALDEAYIQVKKDLGIQCSTNDHSISRIVVNDTSTLIKPNIVLIIMESMSAAKMKRHGCNKNLTPFLDSLSYQSLYFENIYTSGIHTYNGLLGTLFSYPSIYHLHPMKEIRKLEGISSVLKKNGYSTTYITTHDSQFDNVEGFLRANGFDKIVSQSDYPQSKIVSTLGVPDDFMFRFSIPIIDDLQKEASPFFITFLTSSDHGPYYIPDYFNPRSQEIKDQSVEYADWALSTFINKAKSKDWYENTIFIFVADHGAAIDPKYDIALNYYHTPLIFYAPKILSTPKVFDCLGSQLDIFPTLMGIMNVSYTNSTFGIDLINEKREFLLLNNDDKIGVMNNEFLFLLKAHDERKLYRYRIGDLTNYINKEVEQAIKMEAYLKSNIQVCQDIVFMRK